MLLPMVLATSLLVQSANARDDRIVTVDGARYRVRVLDGKFEVNKKSMVVRDTIEERDRQRQAVRLATGCEPTDEFARTAKLRGKLNCPIPRER